MFVCQLHHILDAFLVDGRITNLEFGDIGSRIALFSLVFRFLVGKQGSQDDNRQDHAHHTERISDGTRQCHVCHPFGVGWIYLQQSLLGSS